MTKADSRCATCSRAESSHPWDFPETGESCAEFVQRIKDPERVKRGKRNKRRGYSAEALVARLVGGKRDRASIVDVAVRGEDGRAFAVFECKKRDAKVLHGFMRQAQVGAALMPERPPAYVAIIPHGSEKLDEILVLSTLGEWIDSHGRGVE